MNITMKDSSKLKAIELATKLIVAIQNEDKFSASILLTRIEALGFTLEEEKSTEKRHKSTLETKIDKWIEHGDRDCGVHNE